MQLQIVQQKQKTTLAGVKAVKVLAVGAVGASSFLGVTSAEATKVEMGLVTELMSTSSYAFTNAVSTLDIEEIKNLEEALKTDVLAKDVITEEHQQKVLKNLYVTSEILDTLLAGKIEPATARELQTKLNEQRDLLFTSTTFPIKLLLEIYAVNEYLDMALNYIATESLPYTAGYYFHSIAQEGFQKKLYDSLVLNDLDWDKEVFVDFDDTKQWQSRAGDVIITGEAYLPPDVDMANVEAHVTLGMATKTIELTEEDGLYLFKANFGHYTSVNYAYETDGGHTTLGVAEVSLVDKTTGESLGMGTSHDVNLTTLDSDLTKIPYMLTQKKVGVPDALLVAETFEALVKSSPSEYENKLQNFKDATTEARLNTKLAEGVAIYVKAQHEKNMESNPFGVKETVKTEQSQIERTVEQTKTNNKQVTNEWSTEEHLDEITSLDGELPEVKGVAYSGETKTAPRLDDNAVQGLKNPFQDSSTVYSKNEAIALYNAGAIIQPENGKLMPSSKVNRSQMATFLARAFDTGAGSLVSHNMTDTSGKWFENQVAFTVSESLMYPLKKDANGRLVEDKTSKTFMPTETVKRKELALYMYRLLQGYGVDLTGYDSAASFPDLESSSGFLTSEEYKAIAVMEDLGIFHGKEDGTFGPNEATNRAQLAKVLFNTLNLLGVL